MTQRSLKNPSPSLKSHQPHQVLPEETPQTKARRPNDLKADPEGQHGAETEAVEKAGQEVETTDLEERAGQEEVKVDLEVEKEGPEMEKASPEIQRADRWLEKLEGIIETLEKVEEGLEAEVHVDPEEVEGVEEEGEVEDLEVKVGRDASQEWRSTSW